jgi:hypothetical protein
LKDDSPQQALPDNPGSGQEKWISMAEIRKRFKVPNYTLKYWRSKNKVRAKKAGHLTLYNEDDVRAMTERKSRAKKRIRKQFIAKKLGNIDVGVLMLILALGFLLAYFSPPWGNKTFSRFEVLLPFYWILFFTFVYWLVRFVQYIRKRFFRKVNKK